MIDEESHNALHFLELDLLLNQKRWLRGTGAEFANFFSVEGEAADIDRDLGKRHLRDQFEYALELFDKMWSVVAFERMAWSNTMRCRKEYGQSGQGNLDCTESVTYHDVSFFLLILDLELKGV